MQETLLPSPFRQIPLPLRGRIGVSKRKGRGTNDGFRRDLCSQVAATAAAVAGRCQGTYVDADAGIFAGWVRSFGGESFPPCPAPGAGIPLRSVRLAGGAVCCRRYGRISVLLGFCWGSGRGLAHGGFDCGAVFGRQGDLAGKCAFDAGHCGSDRGGGGAGLSGVFRG